MNAKLLRGLLAINFLQIVLLFAPRLAVRITFNMPAAALKENNC